MGNLEDCYRHIDIFFYNNKEYPFVLLFSTGPAQFNIEMRAYCLKNGYSLNEKELLKIKTKSENEKVTEKDYIKKIGKPYPTSEQDIFKFLDLKYIEPKNRAQGMIISL